MSGSEQFHRVAFPLRPGRRSTIGRTIGYEIIQRSKRSGDFCLQSRRQGEDLLRLPVRLDQSTVSARRRPPVLPQRLIATRGINQLRPTQCY